MSKMLKSAAQMRPYTCILSFYMPVRIYESDPKVVFVAFWTWIKQPEIWRETLDSKSPSMFYYKSIPRNKIICKKIFKKIIIYWPH